MGTKDFHLDGELFGGRKKFQQTIKVVKNAECDDWKKIKYCVS
jgi:DNA ligase-1